MKVTRLENFSSNSIVDKISNLFQFQPILVEIEKNLSLRQSNPIFLKAYKALHRHGNFSYSKFFRRLFMIDNLPKFKNLIINFKKC